MKTQKSKIRRLRAYWRHCKPTWGEGFATGCLVGIFVALVAFL